MGSYWSGVFLAALGYYMDLLGVPGIVAGTAAGAIAAGFGLRGRSKVAAMDLRKAAAPWLKGLMLAILGHAVVFTGWAVPRTIYRAHLDEKNRADLAEERANASEASEKTARADKEKAEARALKAETRVGELERRPRLPTTTPAPIVVLGSGATLSQETCDLLTTLSSTGRQLTSKLRVTRAAPETRHEIDEWYKAVCRVMSKPQCEAFLGATPAMDSWVNYPVNDGGYSQTLRGRSAYLSGVLSSQCR